MLLKDLHVPLVSPHTLWCDNVGALALASNPVFHAKTKHIEVDYHFIHENDVNKDMVSRFISTDDQPLDLASFLALVLFPRVPRSNPSWLVQV